MKKIVPYISTLLILVSCTQTSSSSMIDGSSSLPSLPNGLLPLVAKEGCPVQTIDTHWVCSWSDEFEGDSLNADHWNIEVNGNGGGNQELQFYRAENIKVEEGILAITAKKENFQGRNYTSGRINSKYKVDTRYGRVVFRAQMPGGRGTWAALWMLPLFNRFGQWPNSGEIDIVEYVGYETGEIHTAIHTKKFNHNKNNNFSFTRRVDNVENIFVEYEMIWTPGSIRILSDGVQYGMFAYTPQFNQDVEYHEAFPFDQEFFFILNVAIGGTWGGIDGIDDSIFPTTMFVDFVRLYQFDYASVDLLAPTTPINVAKASGVANTFHWNRSTDDYDVEKYRIFLDGEYVQDANLNQVTFKRLVSNQQYQFQVQAVDFVGRVSEKTEPVTFTFI
jgi:beta-glucanase (GH16 family)